MYKIKTFINYAILLTSYHKHVNYYVMSKISNVRHQYRNSDIKIRKRICPKNKANETVLLGETTRND